MNPSGDESLPHLPPASGDREGPVARALEHRQLCRVALAAMSARQRVVLLWYEIDGLTTEQIAGCLEISESRVRGVLAEARAAGRRAIERALARPGEALSVTI